MPVGNKGVGSLSGDNLGNHTATQIIDAGSFGVQFSASGQDIIGDAGGLTYDVPSGDTHDLQVNSTNVLVVNSTGISVTGTIALTSTIDGRDLAVDGAKLDAIEAAADVTDTENVNAAGATMNSDASLVGNTWFLDEDTLASDDATKVASQQSIKAYVDAQVGDVAVSGTPVDNQVAVWVSATAVEGTTGLTYSGSALAVTGSISATTSITSTVAGATTETPGTVELATQGEVDAFLDATKAVTPATLASHAATTANVNSAGAVMTTDSDVSTYSWVLDEDTLVSDSATQVPTQQSVKAYIDALHPAAAPPTATQNLSTGKNAVTISSNTETINGSDTRLGSIIAPAEVVDGAADDWKHAITIPAGKTVTINDCQITQGRGYGIWVESGGKVTLNNCWVAFNRAGAIKCADETGEVVIQDSYIGINGMNADAQIYSERLTITRSHLSNKAYSPLVSGTGAVTRSVLMSDVFWTGSIAFSRCSIVIHRDNNFFLTSGSTDLRSGDNVVAARLSWRTYYPDIAFGLEEVCDTNTWIVPASAQKANLLGKGAFPYYDEATDITAANWANATAYSVGDVVAQISDGALYSASSSGTSSGTDVSDDVGVTWAAYTSTWEKWREHNTQQSVSSYSMQPESEVTPPYVWHVNPQTPGSGKPFLDNENG